MSESTMQPLLIELGTEELPVKALPGLARAFFDGVIDGLGKRGVAIERGDARPLYSPRRLAVLLPGVAAEQPEQTSEVLGPYVNIALDGDGQPTRALQGFAGKAGVEWTQLSRITDNKGERFVHRSVSPGVNTAALLPAIIAEAVAAMPIPKPMRWGDHDFGFARPLHWLVVVLGSDVVEAELFGIHSDRMSRGHRFMHDKPVWIGSADDYVDALRGGKVLVDPDERRACIVAEAEKAASALDGSPRLDAGILEEVNGLTEWPRAVACSFDPEFLAVPAEALIATMETHQKFFPVLDADGKLSEHFIGIANIESRDVAEVGKGYERVIRPRFADAQFFFVEDMKQGLASMVEGLTSVTYQAKLGTLADKVARVASLAESIATQVGVDPAQARRAAELSKADLQSRLVGEFPELQGTAGRYYAAVEGEPVEVASAIDESYMPRFAGDAIAPSQLGQVVAIAERLDTLAGGFAAGLKPTGNKDPFALRRNALGLARTLIEANIDLPLDACIFKAMELQPVARAGDQHNDTAELDLRDFIFDRLRGYFADQGVSSSHFDAVLQAWPVVTGTAQPGSGSGAGTLPDFDRRLKAIGEFAKLPEAEALAAANKRIGNILRKVEGELPDTVDPALFAEDAERELAKAVDAAIADTDPLLAERDYVAALARLAILRPPVDRFFDEVMVNADDAAVRDNRLALLSRLQQRFFRIADISVL